MLVEINWPKAKAICGQLLAALRTTQYPYGETWALPQTFIPSAITDDPVTHARFLFYSCHYMRGTIKSDLAIKRLIILHHRHPKLFDPEYASQQSSFDLLFEQLGELIGYKTVEISRYWQENSRRLVTHWNGDPRAIFAEVVDAESLYRFSTNARAEGHEDDERTKGFLGFQKKMASMLAYFLMDAKLVAPFTASPPVDFHLVRIMLATGILTATPEREDEVLRYEHLTPAGIKVLERYATEHEVSLVELGNALWMLSVVLCSRAPGNMSSGRKKGVHGKAIQPVPLMIDWDNAAHRAAHLASCGSCPLESSCTFNVPSGPYYQGGKLEIRRRNVPSADVLHPLMPGLPGAPRTVTRRALPVADYVFATPRNQPSILLFEGLPIQHRPKRELI